MTDPEESQRVPLPRTEHSRPEGATWVDAPQETPITVHILLRHRTPLPLDDLAKGRLRLSVAEFSEKHGADPAALDRVRRFAEEHGLTVIDSNPTWRTVSLEGDAASLGHAFGVSLLNYELSGRRYRSYTGQVSLPKEIAAVVEWVFGLHEHGLGVPSHTSAGPAPGRPSVPASRVVASESRTGTPSPPVPSYTPPRFAELYDFPDNLGSGECVGVLALSGGYSESDMRTFFDELGLPMPTILDVGPNLRSTDPSTFWFNFEVTMDVQVVSSCVPEATTVVYFSGARTDDEITYWTYFKVICMGLFDDVHSPSVLTMSAGLPENLFGNWTLEEAEIVNDLLACASLLGVTVCMPAGDSGSIFPNGFGMFSAPTVPYFPGSSPWVLCCGGTSLTVDELGQAQNEVVWNCLANHMWNVYLMDDGTWLPAPPPSTNPPAPPWYLPSNLGSGSGGVSWYFDLPWFQEQANVPPFEIRNFVNWAFDSLQTIRGRGVPDIAANADFLSGYRVFIDGQWRNGGGTSASTPLMASLMVRCNEALGRSVGYVTPWLYELKLSQGAEIFNQIEGNNGGYLATKGDGWNPCVGLGSPKGRALLKALRTIYP
ncbi:MAG TPA: S53 family peptidase [Thermoanaerobaculia bacterium]|nr:S53 family peptidase [Thermoanaerobaculia bacterium]